MKTRYERKSPFENFTFWVLIALTITIILFFASCTVRTRGAFELLGRITETQLQRLFKVEAWQIRKDSVYLVANVPHFYTQKVLGKDVCIWLTREGEATLKKQDLFISLEYRRNEKDSSLVKLIFKKYAKNSNIKN